MVDLGTEPPSQEYRIFKFDQKSDSEEKTLTLVSQNGKVVVENLSFVLNDEFKAGRYTIKVRDVSKNIFNNLPEISISLTILPEQEEEPVKGGAKKK